MFASLSLKNFRGFADLSLSGLKRVNLIVGKNNSGKTSLLEGIAILADNKLISELPVLFRSAQGSWPQRVYRWLVRDGADDVSTVLESAGQRLILSRGSKATGDSSGGGPIIYGANGINMARLGSNKELRCRIISTRSRSSEELVKTFARAVRQRDGEARLESLLRAVDPRIRKARVDVAEDGNVIVVDIGLSEMIPLAQAGEGLNRLVSIFADLVGEQPQVCFIDEVENGVHHTVLPEVWTGIAEVAEKLDIQVFATTHSFECVQAAHEAFSKRPTYDFSVVQLFRLEDRSDGRVLNRDLIESGLKGNIDLR